MSNTYKLIYFNGMGAAEFIRYLFVYGGVDYEDKRVDFQNEWGTFKESAPFGQLPLLEYNGKTINQSTAIGRFIARKVKLAGNNELEDLEIDSIVDTVNDFRLKATPAFRETDPDKKQALIDTVKNEHIPYYLSRFETLAKKNNGYLAAGRLTWADFFFATSLDLLNRICSLSDKETLAKYPTLAALKVKIESHPAIKKWIEKRPVTPF